jgi:phosphoglycolate phosphatase
MLKAILFDKDGTLIDFQKSWGPATARVIADFAKGDAALAHRLAATLAFDEATQTFPRRSPFVAGTTQDFAPAWAALLHRPAQGFNAVMDAALAVAVTATIAPVCDLPSLCDALRARGLRLGLGTNDAEGSARRQLAALGVADRFDFVAGYDSGFGAKPAPGMALAFARALKIAPSQVALVGDSRHDLETARAAGAMAVAVLSGPATREDLAPYADHVLDDVSDLPAFVDRLRG